MANTLIYIPLTRRPSCLSTSPALPRRALSLTGLDDDSPSSSYEICCQSSISRYQQPHGHSHCSIPQSFQLTLQSQLITTPIPYSYEAASCGCWITGQTTPGTRRSFSNCCLFLRSQALLSETIQLSPPLLLSYLGHHPVTWHAPMTTKSYCLCVTPAPVHVLRPPHTYRSPALSIQYSIQSTIHTPSPL